MNDYYRITKHLLTDFVKMGVVKRAFCVGGALVASLSVSIGVIAQTAPSLGSEAPFGIVSSTFTNTAAGTTINGNVCFTTGPAFPATVTGTTGPCPAAVGTDQTAALAILNGQACTPLPAGPLEAVVIGANPAGTIPPGCYTRAGAIDITASGIVTLNGNGVYIFRSTGGAVTTGATSRIVLAGGACADNVFWAPVGATSLGAASTFVGNILDAAGVTIGLGAAVTGRALAFGGTVTTNSSTITVPGACAAPPPAPPTLTVTKVSNGGVGAFSFTGSNGFAPQTITTAAPGVGVSGATQTLTAAGVVTTVTESAPPAGFTLASITCSGLGAGGTATPSIATRTVTLDAAATSTGAAIACTFTNTFAAPPGATPTLSTVASPSVALGGSISDTATLVGGAAPTGTITFNLFGPTDATCTGAVLFTSIVPVSGNGSYTSTSFMPLVIGTYRWIANYSGDTNNAATANTCNAPNESVLVTAIPIPIPTLSEWAMILLAGLLAFAGFVALRKQGR